MDTAIITLFVGFAVSVLGSILTLMLFFHRQLTAQLGGLDQRLRTVEQQVAVLVHRTESTD